MSILLALWLLFVVSAGTLLVLVSRSQQHRKIGVEAATSLLLSSLPLLLVFELPFGPLLFLESLHLVLLVLAVRVWVRRLEPNFLSHSTLVNVAVDTMIMVVGIIGLYWAIDHHFGRELLLAGLVADVAVALVFAWQVIWNIRHYNLKPAAKTPALKELPTLSLCIPARNEDHALNDCLQAALASDYPKLEVIVLDDCSQDKTSEVIKSFAHQGVRFVQGAEPATGWLGKNQALQTLAQQASGDVIMFISVDTRLQEDSISQLVGYLQHHNLDMLSVLPQNRRGLALSTLMGTLQYVRRIVWPLTKRHIPVSSKAWLIKAAALRGLGGFASVRHKVVPEVSFARRLFAESKYRFLISTTGLGMTTDKKWTSQVQTAIRLLYPSDKRQPLLAWLHALEIALFMLLPLVITFQAVISGNYGPLAWLSITTVSLITFTYNLVLFKTHPGAWWLAGLLWPLVAVQEIVLVVASLLLYEFSEVDWKGRNVCYAVLNLPPRPVVRALSDH